MLLQTKRSPVITDGPFAETKEQLGGYHLIECQDLDEAISIAKRIPTIQFGGAGPNRSAGRTIFPLSNETEVEKCQEQNGIDYGTESGEFGRLDEAGAKDGHRNAIHPQIKENA